MVATREVAAAPLRVVVRDRAPLLPKIAFVLIGVASLLGTALSNRGLLAFVLIAVVTASRARRWVASPLPATPPSATPRDW